MAKRGRGRPPKHRSEAARTKHRRKFGKNYYDEHRDEISKKRSKRWKSDPEYRDRVRQRGEEERALRRAKLHQDRLEADKAASEAYWDGRRILTPRVGEVGGQPQIVYSTGALGRAIYRTMPTVRRWIANRVLPGYSWKDEHGRYWFSQDFCNAARTAVERVYLYDGRRSEKIMRQLLVEELNSAGVSWRPFDEPRKKKGGQKAAPKRKK